VGVVREQGVKPVGDAEVFVAREYEHNMEPAMTGRTDASGTFQIAVPDRTARYRIRAQAAGLVPGVLRNVGIETRLDIVLEAGRTIEGVVLDRDTQQPVPTAQVEARDVFQFALFFAPGAGVAGAVSDLQGRFRIEGLGPGSHAITATAPGYGRGGVNVAEAQTRVQVTLARGGSIAGVVIDGDRRPVSGAAVGAEGEPDARQLRGNAITDRNGRFTLSGLPTGSYRMLVRHQGSAAGVASGVRVQAGRETRADVRLEMAVAVGGRFVDSERRPVKGQVCVGEINGVDTASLLGGQCSNTEDDGQFAVSDLPAGHHRLRFDAIGFVSNRFDIHVAGGQRTVSLGDLEVDAGLQIRGRVVDEARKPVAGATVTVLDSGYSVQAEVDGAFRLGALAPGAKRLWIKAPGFREAGRNVDPGTRVEIVLVEEASR
jgi:hypothetical protein